ncbi:MAG: hypothetical protein ACRDRL_25655, partial [Sciscionella sp.]
LLWGVDPAASAVATYAAHVLAAHAGVACDAEPFPQAGTRPVLWQAAVDATSGSDVFSDPDVLDAGGPRLRPLLLEVIAEEAGGLGAARRALPGADVLAPAEELGDAGKVAAICAAALCLRFELAALYLGLAEGKLGGSSAVTSAPV